MVTIKDIAAEAGVALSTVSKVLNNYPGVSEETRQKVMSVVTSKQFAPNSTARRLVQKNSRSLGFIISGIEESNPNDIMPFQMLRGALTRIQKLRYEVVFYPITSQMQCQKSYAQFCRENNLAGVIISGLRTDDRYYEQAQNSDIPCIGIDLDLNGERNHTISVDNVRAAYSAVEYLIRHGHRCIGAVNGKENTVVGSERYTGYCQALRDYQIDLNPEWVVDGGFQEEIAYQKVLMLLEMHPEITALFCSSDIMAMGVYRAAEKAGRSIPQSLSVIGFDDFPVASYVSPPLTTVRQDFFRFGDEAVQLLVRMIESSETFPHHVFVDYQLIIRDSVARLPGQT